MSFRFIPPRLGPGKLPQKRVGRRFCVSEEEERTGSGGIDPGALPPDWSVESGLGVGQKKSGLLS